MWSQPSGAGQVPQFQRAGKPSVLSRLAVDGVVPSSQPMPGSQLAAWVLAIVLVADQLASVRAATAPSPTRTQVRREWVDSEFEDMHRLPR
ncbi:MAG: hypothetical protein DHS20C15_11980 [Planctomycetota bacterium]|nr:MAG: hypothetical protein DHS20C15_11980 [Planctomycetota bacterium]